MKTRTKGLLAAAATLATAALLLIAPPASAATLTEVTNFGANPSNMRMHLYVPDTVQSRPGLLVALHWCTGTGPVFYQNTQFAQLADRYGFIVIYPSATRSSRCFDVASPQALTRGGGSDPVGIRSMVSYVQSRYSVDPNRIFATGMSSGGMMTNVMLALYPDVFRAGAAFAGVPYTCFATTDGSEWNSQCANGQIIRTAQQWGDAVRNAFPGYTGPRPRMQLWHGTNDETLRYQNFTEEIKQWTNVHGLSQTPTYTDTPASGQTRTRYGGTGGQAPVEAISMQGVTHNLPINAAEAIRFFGLDTTTPPSSPPPSTTFSLVGAGSGKCIDVPGYSQNNGTGLIIYTCHGGTNQRWTQTSAGELRIYNNTKCMEAGSSTGSRAVINSCTGGNNQKWTFNANGTVSNVQSGLCLDVNGGSTANDAPVIVWTCHGGTNQQWTRRP